MQTETKYRIFGEYLYNTIVKGQEERILTPDFMETAVKERWKLKLKSIYDLSKEDKIYIFEKIRERRLYTSFGDLVGLHYNVDNISSESRNRRNHETAMLSYTYRDDKGNLKGDWLRVKSGYSNVYLKSKGYDMGSEWLGFDNDLLSTDLATL